MFDDNTQSQQTGAPMTGASQLPADPSFATAPAAPTSDPTSAPAVDTSSFNLTPVDPPAGSTPSAPAADFSSTPVVDPTSAPMPAATTEPMASDTSAPAPVTSDTQSAPAGNEDLMSIKKNALTDLTPLLSQLDQTPEEKFRTTMMLIQASDDQSLIQSAYAAAKEITDEKVRAQALLDIVNEINYFSQQSKAE